MTSRKYPLPINDTWSELKKPSMNSTQTSKKYLKRKWESRDWEVLVYNNDVVIRRKDEVA